MAEPQLFVSSFALSESGLCLVIDTIEPVNLTKTDIVSLTLVPGNTTIVRTDFGLFNFGLFRITTASIGPVEDVWKWYQVGDCCLFVRLRCFFPQFIVK